MSRLLLSYLFKTNLATFRSAILNENTDKICRILDFERHLLSKDIDSEGNTALLLAVEYTSPLTVRLLLDHGAEPDKANSINFKTPLGLIASKSYDDYSSHQARQTLEMARILLDHGAFVDKPIPCVYKDENNKEYFGKETPLMIAVRKRNRPLVKLFIERKANVDYVERQSEIRSIHYAISNGDEDMFDLLTNAGASTSSVLISGNNTLVHWFCYKKENDEHLSLVEKLIEKELDINAQNWQQRTPLMIAVRNNMTKTCDILLKHQADTDKRDYNGNQAIDLSVPGSECSKILLQVTRTENDRLQLIASPFNRSKNTIIRTQRINSMRRHATDLSEIIHDQTKTPDNVSKGSEDDNRCIQSPRPNQRPESKELQTKPERMYEKSHKTRRTPRLLRKLYRERGSPVDTTATVRL